MARKRSQTVEIHQDESDRDKIVISREDLSKPRKPTIPGRRPADGQARRRRALLTGRSRKHKHKGKRGW